MSHNPYFHRGPIDDPAHFYGRQRELTTAFNFLKQRQCLSIVGLRRIGKTSLLLQLQNPQVAESVGLDPDVHKKMCFIYLDTHVLSELSAQEIYQRLAWEVVQQFEYKSPNSIPGGVATSVTDKSTTGFRAFQQSLELAKKQDCTVLFLFDEFEYLASNPQLSFNFFGQLRSLVAPRNPPVYVTASHRPLEELTYRDNVLGSPFFTIFQPLRLVSLTRKETQTLIRKPAREAGVEFSAETEDFLLELTGGHPFATQIACYYAFDLQQQSGLLGSDDFAEIEETTYADIRGHLTGYWADLTDEEQTALVKLVSDEPAAQTICRNLREKVLVTRRKGVYQPFSRLFSLFIDEQTPSSMPSEPPEDRGGLQEQRQQTITWLHLCDLHFHESRAYDENIVLNTLLDDVHERIRDDGLQPDFIIISGDIAFKGHPKEYVLAQQFLSNLLQTTGLPKDRLFLVPGNHDVDRDAISPLAAGATNILNNRDAVNRFLTSDADRALVFQRFHNYRDFINKYLGKKRLPFDNAHYFYVKQIEVAGRRVAILGLNSAWLAASDEDKAQGVVIGERQTRAALDAAQAAGAELKIALLHHPFDWLREFDQNDSAAMLLDSCDFVLHGHLHRTAMAQLVSPDSGAMVIAAGACYETREYPNSYNFARLDFTAGTGTVYLRRYSDERGGFWAKDTLTYRNVPDGVYTFTLRSKPTSP